MIKYRAKWGEVQRVVIERETETSVWVDGRRRAKMSEHCSYFNKWDEAKDYLLGRAVGKRDGCIMRLSRAEQELKAVKALRMIS